MTFLLRPALYAALVFLLCACGTSKDTDNEPEAARKPIQLQRAGNEWQDPYDYLRDMNDPDARAYLSEEAQYLRDKTEPWASQISAMTRELNRNLPVERRSPPVISGEFELSFHVERGSQYPIYTRKHLGSDRPEVLLDLNARAGGNDYYRLGGFATSPDDQQLAFTEDVTGAGLFTLQLKSLMTGASRKVADNVAATLGWCGDHLVYVSGKDVLSLAPDGKVDVLYSESDPAFALSIRASGDRDSLLVISESHTTTEIHRLLPGNRLQVVAPRRNGHKYRVKYVDDKIVVLTNLRSPDFEIAIAQPGDTTQTWRFLDTPGIRIVDFEPTSQGVFLHLREGTSHGLGYLSFQERFQAQSINHLMSFDKAEQLALHTLTGDGQLRFWRRSLLSPDAYWQIERSEDSASMLFAEAAPPDYDVDEHVTEHIMITARDGVQIPVTLYYQVGKPLPERPLLLSAYGAYGLEQDLRFDPARLPFLRRGFILAWVHVRGGGALGSDWHAAGTGLNKERSFFEFQDVAVKLPELGYGAADQLAGRFASAGGTIGGFVINNSPELLSVVTLRSPFVDIVSTLLDDTQPLTHSDRLEWGDPRETRYLDYQLGYSPYQQVGDRSSPDLLILAGRNDRLVSIHESLKWLARLRYRRTADALMLIDIEKNSGHLGATDQYLRRQQAALELVFIFNSLGIRI